MLASLRSARSLSRKAPARGLALYESVLDTIGKTPIIKVSDRTAPPGVEMYVKRGAAAATIRPCATAATTTPLDHCYYAAHY